MFKFSGGMGHDPGKKEEGFWQTGQSKYITGNVGVLGTKSQDISASAAMIFVLLNPSLVSHKTLWKCNTNELGNA